MKTFRHVKYIHYHKRLDNEHEKTMTEDRETHQVIGAFKSFSSITQNPSLPCLLGEKLH